MQPQGSESGETSKRPVVYGDDPVDVQGQNLKSGKADERPVNGGDMVVGQEQGGESGKAGEHPVDEGDLVVV